MDQVPRVSITGAPMIILTVAGAIVVLRLSAPVLGPVVLSVLLAYALEPAVAALTRVKIPRFFAAVAVFAVLGFTFWTISATATRQINAFVDDLPRTIAQIGQRVSAAPDLPGRGADGIVSHIKRAAEELGRALTRAPRPTPDVRRVAPVGSGFDIRGAILTASGSLIGLASQLFVVILLTFLLVAIGDLYKRKMVKLAGRRWEDKKVTVDVIRTIDRQIERYLVVRLLISLIVAALTAAGLFWLDVLHPVVWGAIAGALNVVPFVGPGVACALITLAALFQFQSVGSMAAAGLMSVAVAAVEGNLITPWLTSRAGELNTVAVFVAVLFWGWLWDVWGLLLAVPITVAMKAAADHIESLQPLGELLGR
jgi:predicted PurR-regulated permease PerM